MEELKKFETPILKEEVYTFRKRFLNQKSDEFVSVDLHITHATNSFYLDLNELFNTANSIVEFSGANLLGIKAEFTQLGQMFDWLAHISRFGAEAVLRRNDKIKSTCGPKENKMSTIARDKIEPKGILYEDDEIDYCVDDEVDGEI